MPHFGFRSILDRGKPGTNPPVLRILRDGLFARGQRRRPGERVFVSIIWSPRPGSPPQNENGASHMTRSLVAGGRIAGRGAAYCCQVKSAGSAATRRSAKPRGEG